MIPKIDEASIREFVDYEDLEKGRKYFNNNSIFDARVCGLTIKALCRGSQDSHYSVSATFDKKAIKAAVCSCPVGKSGCCKHVAALLLMWLHKPKEFRESKSMEESLKERSKEELVELVKKMARFQPELESMVEAPAKKIKKKGLNASIALYSGKASTAFNHIHRGWGFEADIAARLDAVVDDGKAFVKQKEYSDAFAVFHGVAKEVLDNYEMVSHEEGDIGQVVNDCVEELGKCLSKVDDINLRERILHALFEIYNFDVDFGGVGLSDEVPDIILKRASKKERYMVASWVRALIPPGKNDGEKNWKIENYGGFVLELEKDKLGDEAFLKTCRETGRLNDLIERLLSLKRVNEAIDGTRLASDYEMLELADIFVKHRFGKTARDLMEKRAEKTKDSRIFEWLRDYCKKNRDFSFALEFSQKLFKMHSSFSEYKKTRGIAKEAGAWNDIRPLLFDQLKNEKEHSLITEIYLDEGEIDNALQAVKNISRANFWGEDMREKVAHAAKKERPLESIALYIKLIEELIGLRGRENYKKACLYLGIIQDLYIDNGMQDKWKNYITHLREQNKNLRVFNEELEKQGIKLD